MSKKNCPICDYSFDMCQCRFGGNAHPDRSKRARGQYIPSLKRWLDKEHEQEQILSNAEKKYLSAVIKPFRDKVTYICKVDFVIFDNPEGCVYQHIVIGLNDNSPEVVLPLFKDGTMYKGMVAGHVYILEDLGL